ncbi:MAG: glycosyltransferase [Desulfovibrionaceae bacterium]
MRIQIFSSDLRMGGAERAAVNLADLWTRAGHAVTLSLLGGPERPRHQTPAPEVEMEFLDIFHQPRGPWDRLRRMAARHRRIRGSVRQHAPDVVVSVLDLTNVRVLLATLGLGVPVIACEHTDPAIHDIGSFWSWLRRRTYPRAAALTVLNEPMAAFFGRMIPPGRIVTIPNPIDFPDAPSQRERYREILYLGRFSSEKRIPLLLESFARTRRPEWGLTLVGDGPEREPLVALAARLGIAEHVHFPGMVRDPFPSYCRADVFVLPSLYEGLPTALAEAMGMGLACVATATNGAAALIESGVNGLLVNVDAPTKELDDALAALMDDPDLRERLGSRAMRVRGLFGSGAVMSRWDRLFRSLGDGG